MAAEHPGLVEEVQRVVVDASNSYAMRKSAIVAVTSEDYARNSRMWSSIEPAMAIVAPPCPPPPPGQPSYRETDGLHVGFLGRIVREKGLEYLVRGFRALPDADIPLAQVSLRRDLPAVDHIAIGRALAPLRDEGVLIVGSGMSFHNMRAFGAQVTPVAAAWDDALTDAVTDPDPAMRAARIAAWDSLPHARFAHPREEHLLPLMVAMGAGGDSAAVRDFRGEVMGWVVSGYRFG